MQTSKNVGDNDMNGASLRGEILYVEMRHANEEELYEMTFA